MPSPSKSPSDSDFNNLPPAGRTRSKTRPPRAAVEEEVQIEDDEGREFVVCEETADFYNDQKYASTCDEPIEEPTVPLEEIGSYIKTQNFSSNAEIINVTPHLTTDIPAVSVLEFVGNGREDAYTPDINTTIAGIALMANRLMFENSYLMRELQALKRTDNRNLESLFDNLVFKTELIQREYVFPGAHGIPAKCLNDILKDYDQSYSRRAESTMGTVRRFVRFLLEHIIPVDLRTVFTLRERGGYEHLKELPPELTCLIKEMCLEAVGLFNITNKDEEDQRNDFAEMIFRFMKFALQEIRRMPRKPKSSRGGSHF
ncbi:hypothetical protein M3Y98_00521300 [Aphelenchoides besseyi]|nr:hypothetical protein M3Y98_00521300 [Aphelenchoides besseyi]KAI6207951.1 hypothetical protein M3Y96_00063100 [Aphelenchoides besseyi]